MNGIRKWASGARRNATVADSHMKRKRGRKEKEERDRNEMAANPPVALSLRCFASFAMWKL